MPAWVPRAGCRLLEEQRAGLPCYFGVRKAEIGMRPTSSADPLREAATEGSRPAGNKPGAKPREIEQEMRSPAGAKQRPLFFRFVNLQIYESKKARECFGIKKLILQLSLSG